MTTAGGNITDPGSDTPRTSQHLPEALYVHVPFCRHHCGYCDFAVIANKDRLIPQFLEALETEIRRFLEVNPASAESQPDANHTRPPVSTLFVGGGTPTHLPPADLRQLCQTLHRWFSLTSDCEFSVEANPDGLCDDRLRVLKDHGVNRISLGVQSFDAAVLSTLERTHTPDDAATAVQRAAERVEAVSLDLIFGVPGQTLDSWERTLDVAVKLPVRHISTYGLTFESGTPFHRRERSGRLLRVPEELEREMYLLTIDRLTDAGFEHYEVSNFCKPGSACRHNQVYWNANEYLAFGPGAARYVNGERSVNLRSVPGWLNAVRSGRSAIADSERLSVEDRAREAVMLALRMLRGLHLPSFEARFGFRIDDLAGEAIRNHQSGGLLQIKEDFLKLTRNGLLLADSVISDLL